MSIGGGNASDTPTGPAFQLWSDDPDRIDLLAFDAIAETLVDAVLDDSLDPVALGVSGRWGSGKTTVLHLVEAHLAERDHDGAKVLPILTEAWRYDPALGAKESLITEVLERLAAEITDTTDPEGKAKAILKRLAKRVDWAKALKMAAKTSVTMQIPTLDSILELVKPPEGVQDDTPRTLDGFRTEFAELLDSEALAHVRRVVVLVDDLDRCLPPTVVDTLETIRLFLAVPKMSFIIAADEDRVAEAIGVHFSSATETEDDEEHPSRLYLHKIVQTTIPLPSLSRFDTQAYLLLLQVRDALGAEDLQALIDQCSRLRSTGATLDEITPVGGVDLAEPMAFAARLTPILYEKFKGNPRRIKRFLNDLRVRQSVASRRGIALAPEIVAKLMVLEYLVSDGFKQVMDWMAHGDLRSKIAELEQAAGRSAPDAPPSEEKAPAEEPAKGAKRKAAPPEPADPEFADALLRWAKLPPSLGPVDLTPYLHLAASFSGHTLVDTDLPERLRDIASNLLSSSRAEQRAVKDEDLVALRDNEPEMLLQHLGRAARDRPTEQRQAVAAILRIGRLHPDVGEAVAKTLGAIPAADVEPATVLQFEAVPPEPLLTVLRTWQANATNTLTRNTLDDLLKGGA
jgi:hypothetical protein